MHERMAPVDAPTVPEAVPEVWREQDAPERRSSPTPVPGRLQGRATLRIGAADAREERAADRTADRVVAVLRRRDQPLPAPPARHHPDLAVLRRRSEVGRDGGAASDRTSARIDRLRGRGRPLPGEVRRSFSAAMGVDLGGVRLHTGPEAEALNQAVGAQAFTLGQDIFFGSAVPDLATEPGRHLLAHELAHTLEGSTAAPAPRTEGAGPEVRRVPVAEGGPVVRRLVLHDPPVYTSDNGRAGSVEVHNIRGTPLPEAANPPRQPPPGWPELQAAGHVLGGHGAAPGVANSHYNAVRMHLWNGRLGGPGTKENLAPGPCTVNSLMSAGPELDAKDAVAAGHTIWLRTEVEYSTGTVNGHDFTSVIPSRFRVQWGEMRGGVKGPVTFTWKKAVDQPKGAMTSSRKAQYAGVTTPSDLDKLLQNASLQEKAQAYEVVPAALRAHLLREHPTVFQAMGQAERVQAMCTVLAPQETLDVLTALGLHGPRQRVEGALSALFADATATRLQDVVALLPLADQVQVALWDRGVALAFLGELGKDLSRTQYEVFMLPVVDRSEVLRTRSPAQIDQLLGPRQRVPELLDRWAEDELGAGATVEAKRAFMQARVCDDLYLRYEEFTEWQLRAVQSAQAQETRRGPDRHRRKAASRAGPYTR